MLVSVIIGSILLVIALIVYVEYRNEKRYQEERKRAKEQRTKRPTPKVTKRPATPVEKKEAPSHKPQAPKERLEQTAQKTKERPNRKTEERKPLHKAPQKKGPSTTDTDASPTQPQVQKTPLPKPDVPSQTPQQAQKTQRPHTKPPSSKKPHTAPAEKAAVETKTDEAVQKSTEKQPLPELLQKEYPDFNYERLIEMGLSKEEAEAFVQELIPQIGEQIPLLDEAMKIPDFHKMERLTHSIKGSSTTIGTGGISDLLVDYNTYLKTGKELPVAEAYQALLKKYFEKLTKQFQAG